MTTAYLYRLMNEFEFPEFVKNATADDVSIPEEGIPDHLYADDKFKKYPCHTKAATAISAAQFVEDFDTLSEERRKYILKNLLSHAQQLKIAEDITKILTTKPARKEKYALDIVDLEGNRRRLFPIRNETETKKAASYLLEHWRDIPADHRETIANNILKEAADNNYALGEYKIKLEKLSGNGLIDKDQLTKIANYFVTHYGKRGTYGNGANPAAYLINLAALAEATPITDKDKLWELTKIASDISINYSGITEPIEFDVIVSETELDKSLNNYVLLKSGSCYNFNDIDITVDDIKDGMEFLEDAIVDDTFVSRHKLKTKLANLPEKQALIVEELLREKRIKPVLKKEKNYEIPV